MGKAVAVARKGLGLEVGFGDARVGLAHAGGLFQLDILLVAPQEDGTGLVDALRGLLQAKLLSYLLALDPVYDPRAGLLVSLDHIRRRDLLHGLGG